MLQFFIFFFLLFQEKQNDSICHDSCLVEKNINAICLNKNLFIVTCLKKL